MNTKPAAHTPTPWRVDGGYSGYDFIVDKEGSLLAQLGSVNAKPLYRNAKANAAYIVLAVNAHEELLIAAKDFLYDMRQQPNLFGASIERMEKLIAKAEGL